MTYTYNSKGQLSTLRDNSDGTKGFVTPTPSTAQGYTYDNSGNLTRDEHKKITITYNPLNLPRRILFDNGSQLDITYDAAGNKLKKQVIYPNGDRSINNLPIPSGTYTASGTITSTGRVDNGSNVTFKAGTAVLLNPGFETKQGGVFLGKTETGQSANYTQDYVMGIEYQNTVMQAIYNSEGRLYFTGSTTRYEYTMTDHLGNARVSFTDQNADGTPEIIQENHYYPFGLAMEGPWVNDQAEDNKYQYNGKELNDDFGLGWMDYGARWYDASVGRWNGVDPLAEKYSSISPYAYVANNPIIYIDPDGRQIDPASQKEWDKQKQTITDQRNKLQNQVDKFNDQSKSKGWSVEKLAEKIGNLNERIEGLSGSLANLNALEASTQSYSLKTGAGEEGGTTYDPKTGNIVFSFDNTANFVHETTHGGQFENGDFAFDNKTGMPYGQDVHDELEAYKAQFAYDPSSVSGLKSLSSASSFNAITTGWVQGITKSNGDKLYAPGGSANTGIAPVNINTNRDGLMAAYPHQAAVLKTLPANFTLKSLPTIHYKK